MQLTNEQLARMYGTYMGCEVKCKKLAGWKLSQQRTILNLYFLANYFERIEAIILTTLSQITTEDANTCANLCGLHTDGNNIRRTNHYVFIENDSYELQISHNGYVCLRKNGVLYNMDMRKVIDFLRSNKRHDGTEKPVYDCGYGEIRSLIEAGYALDKTKINNQ